MSVRAFKAQQLSLKMLCYLWMYCRKSHQVAAFVMALKVTKDARGQATPGGFGINKQELETNVHVMDGETVVLGGAFQETMDNQTNKVPFFGDLQGLASCLRKMKKLITKPNY